MTLSVSSTFVNSSRPLGTVYLPDNSYVLSIAELPSHYAAAASAPSNAIHTLDKSDPRTIIRSLSGHPEGTSYMRSAQLISDNRRVLLSCGSDGTVNTWDERTGTVAVQMNSPGGKVPFLCCDASPDGSTVAAGTVLRGEDASILYWDPRSPTSPLRKHTSTHSDDITAVHFAQHGTNTVLLSASTDGLLCTSNPYEVDEDEAGIGVANWGCSISKAGWLPRNSGSNITTSGIWASSDMETLSFWSDELDLVKEVDRGRLVQPSPVLPWVTDYIIDCHTSPNGSFRLFAGSNEGDIALVSPHGLDERWTLEQLYTRGHTEVVRCILWDEQAGLLLTGGEDARLNIWSSPVHSSGIESAGNDGMDVDLP